ncbi:MAG: putative transporter, rane spanning protein [Homoserinimonas sp.]|jgi:NitT/TauT family transport system permease protein|nr:putative transporter, rane spanning protein [Homoserinimonas sp.]
MSTSAPIRNSPHLAGRSWKAPRPLAQMGTLVVLPVIIFIVWAIVATVVDSLVFPHPGQALAGLWLDLQRESYRSSILSTVTLLLIGWALAAVIGTLVGFGLGLSQFWSAVFATPLFALYSIPKVTLYPVFLIFLGIGEESSVAFAFFHGVFPMALLVMAATAAMDKNLLKLADVLVMPWHVKLRKILIPALLPTIVTALRIAFGLTLMGLILAGMFSATSGLGHELVNNIAFVRIDRIAGQVLFIVILAIIPGLTLRWLETRVTLRYQPE